MSPYRRPVLRYISHEALKTTLKRKIKFAWSRANDSGNRSLLILIHSFVIAMFLTFEKNSAVAVIEMAIVVGLITIARMLWSWCLFFIRAKQRNENAKRMDELQKPFFYQEFWNDYTCNSCGKIFQSLEKAISHSTTEHFEPTIINEK